jgi:single-strand DNA-binding protein
MRIAVSTPKVEGDWSGERETSFYHVTAFGSLAENVANCLRKGTRVVVTGRGEVRNWTGDDGTEYESEGILADAIGPDLRWATAAVTKTAWPGARGSAQSTRDPRSM